MRTSPKTSVRATVLIAAALANGVLLTAHGEPLTSVSSATLKLHLDAAVGVTDAGGGAVSDWADQSGLGNNFGQGTGALQPVLTASQINGLPSVVFTSDRLDAVGTGLNTSSALPFTFFAVTTGANVANGLFDSAPSAANTFRFGGTTSGKVEIHNGSPNVAAPVVAGGSMLSIAAGFQSPQGINRRELSVRAFSSGGGTHNHGYADNTAQAVFNNPDIGTINGGAPYLSGGIAEMLIYSGWMTVNDRFAVERYLRGKYNLTPVQSGVPELLPTPVIISASTRLASAYSQEKAWDMSFGDPSSPFHTSNDGTRANEFVDFDFGAPTLLTQFAYRDANSGNDVTTFNLIFSTNSTFGDGDDITQSVIDGGWHASGVQYDINGGNGYSAQYMRWKVTDTTSDVAGSSLFAFYTTVVPEPASLVLFVLGLPALLLRRQRKP